MSQFEPPAPPEAPPAPPAAGSPDGGTEETELADFFHTDDDLPRPRRQRSRGGPFEAPAFLERLLAPVTAVVVVIIVILLMIWINGGSTATNLSNAAVGVGSRTAAAKPTPRHHHRTAPAPAPSATSATPTIPPAAVGPTTHHHATPRTRGSHHRAARPATASLVVLNNSTRSGLAQAVATEATHKGWPVSQVGNLQRIVAKTTVYYAPGQHAAAMHLAHQFGSVQRIAPNHAGHMHGHGLTLVVTRSWRL